MKLSLNELEVVVHKAARGVGLPVGHAEEAARLAGWLARAGLEPALPLLRDLTAFRERDTLSEPERRDRKSVV
mgnify:CR=1 FL=1